MQENEKKCFEPDRLVDESAEQAILQLDEELSNEIHGMSLPRLVRECIARELKPSERKALELYWFCGKSPAQVAEIMRTDRKKVYKLLDSSKKKLERALRYLILYGINMQAQLTDELLRAVGRAL